MPEWISPSKERHWPNLTRAVYNKTSETDKFNNCAGWAAGDKQWWQPPTEVWHYWPQGAPTNDFSVNSFVKAYELHGFEICADAATETGYEKIAIYSYSNGEFAHAAKSNADGSWSSKLGKWEDISHSTLSALEGASPAYGNATTFMKRKTPNAQTNPI
jgi:hypothetical protein